MALANSVSIVAQPLDVVKNRIPCYSSSMPSWLDHLPSHERQKIRNRMRSKEAYERLREKVKGPEDLKEEMRNAQALAELHFALETEPSLNEALHDQVQEDIAEQGAEALFESAENLPDDIKENLEQQKFIVTVSSHPQSNHDVLVAIPEGNVQEKIPMKKQVQDRYIADFMSEEM